MELAWLFIRKPQIDPNEPVTKGSDKPVPSDWGWCIVILCIAGLLIYAVHTGPDSDYPGGRAPVYFWISLGALVLAPAFLLSHFLDERRANALATAVAFTLFCTGPLVAMSWPASEHLIYEPLAPKTWKAVRAKLPAGISIWAVGTGTLALGAWFSALAVFTRRTRRAKPARNRIDALRQLNSPE